MSQAIENVSGVCQSALGEWLVQRAVERGATPLHGAVFSWLRSDGTPDAAYPEIAGYYLQHICQHNEWPSHSADLVETVSEYLRRTSQCCTHSTIYHFDRQCDWRADVRFCFDFAMIARGLAQASDAFPDIVDLRWGRRYFDAAADITDHGLLASCRGPGSARLPDKWSARFDVHLAKAAAAFLLMPWRDLDGVSLSTIERLMELPDGEKHSPSDNLHPFFYYIEGLLMAWAATNDVRYLECAETTYKKELNLRGDKSGAVRPENLRKRHDATAQALRVAVILRSVGLLNAKDWADVHRATLAILSGAQSSDGGIYFDDERQHRNTWTSIFTFQAIDFVERLESGALAAREASAAII